MPYLRISDSQEKQDKAREKQEMAQEKQDERW